ncbi:hypothetical protein [Kribbella shirazensis]|uniref:Insulinase family protein n=1 Tax=Kribbella shirazensis TaxID=1105143 RepID=A0A7X5ZYM0_9ACTN|nr:hypothetical protein [Kribbella shirazensis]NIK55127.1 hypothetical protein [Kribbella shirazensis]
MTGELRETEVDGVPVFWVPGERRMRGSLWFRVGLADESLPRHGWLHLLEHLALHDRDSIRAPINGCVSMLHTSFDIEGEPDDIAAFLQQLCGWLSAPDFTDLEHEQRVLRAESATRRPGPVDLHMLWRYGAQGPGLVAYDEYGLHTADPERLRSLAAQAFARGNAVLALTGPPPAGLRLPLGDGSRWPVREAIPCKQPLPAGFAGPPGAVALSGVLPRSNEGPTLVRSLRRGLEGGFRHGAGLGYSGWSSYELVDAENAMVTAGIDILPEARPTVTAEVMSVLRRLRDRGPDPTDLRDDLEQEIQRVKAEPAETWMPYLAAREALLGRPVKSRDQLIAEAEATAVEGVRQAAFAMWSNLLVSVDPDAATDPQLNWLSGPPPAPSVVTGQHFKPAGWPVTKGRLTVGRDAAQIETPAGETSASYGELAVVVAYPDGGRQLIRRDGYQVQIEPEYWKDGRQAILAVDAAVSPALRVPMPAREPETIPRSRVTRRDKAEYWLKKPEVWVMAALLFAVILAFATSTRIDDLLRRIIATGVVAGVVFYFSRRRN